MPVYTEYSDLEGFAQFVGMKGTDTDLFYEMYYDLDTECWEEEFSEEPVPNSYRS